MNLITASSTAQPSLPERPLGAAESRPRRRALSWLAVGIASAGLAALVTTLGWSHIAVAVAPKKVPASARTAHALAADALFWSTLHGGHYDRIQPVLERETAAYLEAPNDALTAAHVGWLHVWRAAERARLGSPSATITDDIVLGRKYFQQASALDPSEARFRGFLRLRCSQKASWKFKDVLESRIAEADSNVAAFNHPETSPTKIMLESEFACVGCHQL
jgi:hypothetical protein